MKSAVKPCNGCPWRTDRIAGDIPTFQLGLAEALAATCPDENGMGPTFEAPLFACHESRPGREFACAGWLAACGSAHPIVRLAVMRGDLDAARLSAAAEWPALHGSFAEMIAKLRTTSSCAVSAEPD